MPRPHGFLLWRGKQTSIPAADPLPTGEPCLLVSDDEAFGVLRLGAGAAMQPSEFDRVEWNERHRTDPAERKAWWPGAETLWIHAVDRAEWYSKSLPVEVERDDEGGIIGATFKDIEPQSETEGALVAGVQRIPRLIVLSKDALCLSGAGFHADCDGGVVVVDEPVVGLLAQFKETLERSLGAVFDLGEVTYTATKECNRLPLYWLVLYRNPNPGIERVEGKPEFEALKQEGVIMPYTTEDYPDIIAGLPAEAREVWIETFNAVFEENDGDEGEAIRAAWGAVRRTWEQDESGAWREKQLTKRDGGMDFTADAYLYVPDPEKPSTWKVRIEETPGEVTRQQLGRSASALGPGFRGRRVQMPSDDRRKVAKKLIAEYRKLDTPDEDIPPYLWRLADLQPPEKAQTAAWRFYGEHMDAEVLEAHGDYLIVGVDKGAWRVNYDEGYKFAGRDDWLEVEQVYQVKEHALEFVDQHAHIRHDWSVKQESHDPPQAAQETAALDTEPTEDEKAGRRLRGEKVGLLKELFEIFSNARDKLGEIIGWLDYEDQVPPDFADLFKGKTGVATKEVGGELWHFTWSANAFKDRQGEIFSTAALEQFVHEVSKKEHRGFFNFWHIPGTDFAEKRFIEVVGRFLVEAGPYLEDERGQRAAAFFKRYPDGHPKFAPEGWGASVEYRYLPEERKTGVYSWVWFPRTSTLPRSAAANIWNKSGQEVAMATTLTGERKEAAIELFGSEEFVDRLISDGEKETERLEQAVEHKGETEADEKQASQFIEDLREIAEMIEDDGVRTQVENVIEGLTARNMEERGRTLRLAAGRLEDGEAKTRLMRIAEAMVAGKEYPGSGEDHPTPKGQSEVSEMPEEDVKQEEVQPEAQQDEAQPEAQAEEEEVKEFPFTLDDIASAVKESFELDLAPVAEALMKIKEQIKGNHEELTARVDKLEKREAQKSETHLPRFQLSMLKRASEAEETVVEKDDDLKEQRPETDQLATDGSMAQNFFPRRKGQ